MHKRLDNGMICGIHVSVERKAALARTVEGSIAIRRNDPVLPLQIFETHVECLDLTAFTARIARMEEWISVLCLLLSTLIIRLSFASR